MNMKEDLNNITTQAKETLHEVLERTALSSGALLVIGCSTSEVGGSAIGTHSSDALAEAILKGLLEAQGQSGVYLGIQCCEHLNRAIVLEKECAQNYHFERVQVLPVTKAGGALAAAAMRMFDEPVVVEFIQADAGIDIGQTLIGMHLKHVAVPMRLENNQIGQASLNAAYTRPKLIGGARAHYPETEGQR